MSPKRVIILRHGEKPGDPAAPDDPASPDLSPEGVARANMLVTQIPRKFGTFDFLFAAADSVNSHRPLETVKPLAKQLGLGPDEFIRTYPNKSYSDLAETVLREPKYSDAVIVICWHHGNIPALGVALGATWPQLAAAPELIARQSPGIDALKWNPTVFDRFWILDLLAGEVVKFQSIPQQP
jgi:broad specificity phosphatase PhoE